MSRIHDVGCAADHMTRFPRPSPSIFPHCKGSKTGGVEGLGMRLHNYTAAACCATVNLKVCSVSPRSPLHSVRASRMSSCYTGLSSSNVHEAGINELRKLSVVPLCVHVCVCACAREPLLSSPHISTICRRRGWWRGWQTEASWTKLKREGEERKGIE